MSASSIIPMNSSIPGKEIERSVDMSSLSRKLPRSIIFFRVALYLAINFRKDACASISQNARLGRLQVSCKQSARECAGSIDARRIFLPGFSDARKSAVAVAEVVLPTPPFPPKQMKDNRGFVRNEGLCT